MRAHSEYLEGGALEDPAATSAATSASTSICASSATHAFALGDLADADRDMAGTANAQAGVVAANVRALITGTGQLISPSDSHP